MSEEEKWTDQNYQLNELEDCTNNLVSRLNGHISGCALKNTAHYEFTLRLILNMDVSFGGTYLPISGKDMRYYVPKINNIFNIDFVKDIIYLIKPTPNHYKSEYLGETINWNLGYDTNKFLIKIKTVGKN